MDISFDNLLSSLKQEKVETSPELSIPSVEHLVQLRYKENYDSKDYFEPKDGEYAPKGSLWNNPAINKIKQSLTPEQLQYFESQSDMYNYDFANADIDADLKELTEYVIHGLKSGLHPRDMTDEEKDAMCEIYGPTFYLQFGFTEEDVYGE